MKWVGNCPHQQRVMGIITDGDIRRFLLEKGFDAKITAKSLCNREFAYHPTVMKAELVFVEKIKFLPVINEDGSLAYIEFLIQLVP